MCSSDLCVVDGKQVNIPVLDSNAMWGRRRFGVINSGNKILNFENKDNKDEIKLKNYISDENRFDLYINDRYIETMHYNITLNERTKKLETVDQRLRKILS